MIEWADIYGLLVNKAHNERVKRTRYAWLAARCYPNAHRELLQAIADYFVWFFLADDLFVDRVETVTLDTLLCLTAMIDVLDFDCAGPQPVYGELAWLDVCRRLRGLLSAEAFERFAQGMRLWATTAGLQILNHLRSESVGIRQYETIRRHTSGMNPCLALADAANGGSADAEEFYRPDVQTLYRHANNIVCWSNDIQSLVIEARQPGQFRNMVVIYAAEGRTLQEAIECTAKRVNEEISKFTQLSSAVLPHASAQLCGLVQGFKYWIRGYQDWVQKDTLRYAATFAVADADDRGIL
ncbi:terpene synthase metal-binding domain-containing protein [Hirsutella rhossiliensis]|uniref:Terpene synthase n=1 Tax=Hirsutella rhossiliensis TaxID=111463 RepID=A0A9P8SLZ2_9HYPO|nr:terpene synthase metal-binding domain-containing protein [Hirsutella rhossiliensis]KAH0966290.1 terpene synthase metal-binding domain-containing protein [Hirsutella rhossiliensis]